jgi:hypothetical protein
VLTPSEKFGTHSMMALLILSCFIPLSPMPLCKTVYFHQL